MRYGIWLIERATADFQLQEFSLNAPSPLPIASYDGCTICIITLACGHKLIGPDLTVLSDLESCHAVPPTFIHVDLPDALSHILSILPPLDQLPTYNTKTSANMDLLHTLKSDQAFLSMPTLSTASDLHKVAEPIALKMINLKPPIQQQISAASNFKTSLYMGLVSFTVSMLLHLLVGFLYHKFAHFKNILPLRFRQNDQQIRLKPLVTTVSENEYFELHKDARIQKKSHLLPPSIVRQHLPTNNPFLENTYAIADPPVHS